MGQRDVRELDPKAVEFYEFCDKVVQEDGALPAKFKLMLVMASREELAEAIRIIFVAGGAQAVAACREAIEELLKR